MSNLVHLRKGTCACGNVGGLYRLSGKPDSIVQCKPCYEGKRAVTPEQAERRTEWREKILGHALEDTNDLIDLAGMLSQADGSITFSHEELEALKSRTEPEVAQVIAELVEEAEYNRRAALNRQLMSAATMLSIAGFAAVSPKRRR